MKTPQDIEQPPGEVKMADQGQKELPPRHIDGKKASETDSEKKKKSKTKKKASMPSDSSASDLVNAQYKRANKKPRTEAYKVDGDIEDESSAADDGDKLVPSYQEQIERAGRKYALKLAEQWRRQGKPVPLEMERAATSMPSLSSASPSSATQQVYNPLTRGVFGRKLFCSHWVRTGECDFTQQGCNYLHLMPDVLTMETLGMRAYPRWFREMDRDWQIANSQDFHEESLYESAQRHPRPVGLFRRPVALPRGRSGGNRQSFHPYHRSGQPVQRGSRGKKSAKQRKTTASAPAPAPQGARPTVHRRLTPTPSDLNLEAALANPADLDARSMLADLPPVRPQSSASYVHSPHPLPLRPHRLASQLGESMPPPPPMADQMSIVSSGAPSTRSDVTMQGPFAATDSSYQADFGITLLDEAGSAVGGDLNNLNVLPEYRPFYSMTTQQIAQRPGLHMTMQPGYSNEWSPFQNQSFHHTNFGNDAAAAHQAMQYSRTSMAPPPLPMTGVPSFVSSAGSSLHSSMPHMVHPLPPNPYRQHGQNETDAIDLTSHNAIKPYMSDTGGVSTGPLNMGISTTASVSSMPTGQETKPNNGGSSINSKGKGKGRSRGKGKARAHSHSTLTSASTGPATREQGKMLNAIGLEATFQGRGWHQRVVGTGNSPPPTPRQVKKDSLAYLIRQREDEQVLRNAVATALPDDDKVGEDTSNQGETRHDNVVMPTANEDSAEEGEIRHDGYEEVEIDYASGPLGEGEGEGEANTAAAHGDEINQGNESNEIDLDIDILDNTVMLDVQDDHVDGHVGDEDIELEY